MILTSANNTVNLPAGYYDGFTATTDVKNANGTIKYVVKHTHQGNTSGGACYQTLERTYQQSRGHDFEPQNHWHQGAQYKKCKYCGVGYYSGLVSAPGGSCSTYTVYVYSLSCPYEETEREIDDLSEMVSGDTLVRAIITY
ncbi:hypothetical protein [Butyrivibrio proteoclasticus]|uniref:hypothetical protein n=1 Tax=Butyrivibrio proteoclasticus TaxID=43305 RepID=UPI000479E559|nr:hypothetical protein [Butyrivibrio proteoclasticus]